MTESDVVVDFGRQPSNKPLSIKTLLEVRDLEITFLGSTSSRKPLPYKAVQGLSYTLPSGKTLGIVGESGCGKSITSLSIMRLIEAPGRISQGTILFQGKDLLQLSQNEMEDIRGKEIAMIFQEPMTALNPVLTIGNQLDEQILRHEKVSSSEARHRSIEKLKQVGIPGPEQRYKQYPHQLSGGMRQRAMIAMALTCHPALLIADEPTTALDVTLQAQILELIQDLQEQYHMAVQFISHDLGVISQIADSILVLYGGQVCEFGSAEQILSAPRHPYTQALMNSRPQRERRKDRLSTIEGNVVSPQDLPSGCPFSPRCPKASEACHILKPPPSNGVFCFHPEQTLSSSNKGFQ